MSTISIRDIKSNRVDYVKDGASFFMHIKREMLEEATGFAEKAFGDVRLPDLKATVAKFHPVHGKRSV